MEIVAEVQVLKMELLPLVLKHDGAFCYDVCSVSCSVVFCYFVNLVQEDSHQICLMSHWKAIVIINDIMIDLILKYKCVVIYLFDNKCTILYTCHL